MHFCLGVEAFRQDLKKHYETAADLRARIQSSMQKEQSEIYQELYRSASRDVQVC